MKELVKKWISKLKEIKSTILIKKSIPVLMTIGTGIVTFFIYSYFNREKVNVESVLVRTKDLQLVIDLTLAEKLNKQSRDNSFSDGNENSIYDLTNLDKDYLLFTLKKLNDKSNDFKRRLEEYSDKTNKLNALTIDSLSQEDIEKLQLLSSSPFYNDYDGGSQLKKKILSMRKNSC